MRLTREANARPPDRTAAIARAPGAVLLDFSPGTSPEHGPDGRPGLNPAWPIATAAAQIGTTIRTLRYYEEVGLLVPDRTASNARAYDGRAMARAAWILSLRRVGLATAEIVELDALEAREVALRLGARLTARMEALAIERRAILPILKRAKAAAAITTAPTVGHSRRAER